ncbi:MAG: DMT family transporter [Candidatus Brocadiia bacterium]
MSEPPSEDASRARASALAALFLGAVAIGLAPVFIRLSDLQPIATAFWRLALATPLLWLWVAAGGRDTGLNRAELPPQRAVPLLLAPGLFFALDLALWQWSVALTTAANATLFVNFAPVFVTLVAWFWLGERFGWKFVAGMVVALGGAVVLLGLSRSGESGNLLGDGLSFAAAVFYAGYLVGVKKLRERFPVSTVMAWTSLSATAFLLLFSLLAGEPLWSMSLRGWLMLLGLGLVCHIGGQGLITFAFGHLPASFTSVGLLVQPVAATIFAWILLGESLGAAQIAGGVVVLTGIYMARLGSLRAEADE